MKRFMALLCAAIILIPLSGCVGNSDSEFPVTVGHTKINNAINDAVVLSDNAADIIIEMGYESRIDGRSDECTQKKISKIDSVGGRDKPNTEKIIEMSPQIVIADETLPDKTVKKLESNDIPVLCFDSPSTVKELELMYKTLGILFGGRVTGAKLGEDNYTKLYGKLDKNVKSLPDIIKPKTVCYLFDYKGKTVTGDMLGNIIFLSSGATNIASAMTGGQIDVSAIKEKNPQYIFCDTGMKKMIAKNTSFKNLLAVKNNRIVEIPAESFSRGGVSILDAVKTVTETLYPDGKAGSVAENYGIKYDKDIFLTIGNGADSKENDVDGYRETILIIQQRLDDLGYWPLNETTGYYGETTAVAVSEFQSANGLKTTTGETDKKTLDKMFSDDAVPRSEPVDKQSAEDSDSYSEDYYDEGYYDDSYYYGEYY